MNTKELQQLRTGKGMTQTELAKKIGVDQSQVSRWERGVQPIPVWVEKLIECLFNEKRETK